ncbi:hypothetical protein SAMN05444422_10646 [Halobiforma haloterrestris]|uniref:DUF8121 domain-containing protein n=1 Tax=Natronobacterium haloterrestre TaxID=148448 RepID=A0A1I1HLP7_NATHA|nr:hypothetical protein [Halobiforma haloterrestris]SFC24675.1 hypothetical protein SAMN05444422_10646 [Halobiforma haloterrestris]
MVPHDGTSRSPRPSRRRLLATSGAGIAAVLAGCGGLRAQTLSRPETEAEETETHLVYRDDGDRLATVSLLERFRDEPRTPYGIRLHVWHREGTRFEEVRYELRPIGVGRPPEFSLTRPGGSSWEPIRFSAGEDPETTVLAVSDLGFRSRGSVTFDLLVEPRDEDPFDLRLDVDATLESERTLGPTYALEGSLVHTLPGTDDLD